MGRVKDFEISAVYSPVGFKPKTMGWDMPRVLCGQFPRAQSLYRKKPIKRQRAIAILTVKYAHDTIQHDQEVNTIRAKLVMLVHHSGRVLLDIVVERDNDFDQRERPGDFVTADAEFTRFSARWQPQRVQMLSGMRWFMDGLHLRILRRFVSHCLHIK